MIYCWEKLVKFMVFLYRKKKLKEKEEDNFIHFINNKYWIKMLWYKLKNKISHGRWGTSREMWKTWNSSRNAMSSKKKIKILLIKLSRWEYQKRRKILRISYCFSLLLHIEKGNYWKSLEVGGESIEDEGKEK